MQTIVTIVGARPQFIKAAALTSLHSGSGKAAEKFDEAGQPSEAPEGADGGESESAGGESGGGAGSETASADSGDGASSETTAGASE